MAYRVDDGIDTWPESIRAGRAAMGLYLMCGAWICRGISNGTVADAVVPVEVAAMYGTREWIARLVSVGLWVHVEDGYADRRYFDLNPKPSKVIADREAKRKRQDRWLAKVREGQVRDASRDTSEDDAPPLPKKRGGGRAPTSAPAAALTPPAKCQGFADDGHGWCTHCRLPKANKIHFRRAS